MWKGAQNLYFWTEGKENREEGTCKLENTPMGLDYFNQIGITRSWNMQEWLKKVGLIAKPDEKHELNSGTSGKEGWRASRSITKDEFSGKSKWMLLRQQWEPAPTEWH